MIARVSWIIGILALTCNSALAQSSIEGNKLINCIIRPSQEIAISSNLSGVVADVFVSPGQEVSSGTPIMALDHDIALAELKIAELQASNSEALELAKLQENALGKRTVRLRKALQKKAISAQDFEDTELEHKIAKAGVKQQEEQMKLLKLQADRARLTLEKSTIYSPSKGVIGEDIAHIGEQVGTAPVATLFVIEELRVEAFVPSQNLNAIQPDKTYKIRIDEDPDAQVPVTLDYISPTANLASNTVSIYFRLQNNDILSGSRCELVLP